MSKIFVYGEYQTTTSFSEVNWNDINAEMKKFQGLISKTWLSGLNETIGGFYEFDSQINAQTYIDELLIPFTKQIGANLTVKLFNGEIVEAASLDMNSPFYKS